MKKLKQFFKTIKAFSILEVVISFIIIGSVTAALTPVVIKKTNNKTISIGKSIVITKNCTSPCSLCNSDGRCWVCNRKCDSGYYKITSSCSCKSCTSIDPNVKTCSVGGVINSCKTSYYLSNNSCKLCEAGYYCTGGSNRATCSSKTTNCSACNASNGSCTSCKDSRYIYSATECKTCASKTGNCTSCNGINGTCTACATGYQLNNQKCDDCSYGYYKKDNVCKKCSEAISKCVSCKYENNSSANKLICEKCEDPYATHTNNTACFNCASVSGYTSLRNMCIMRENAGDSTNFRLPSTVTLVNAGSDCRNANNRCCWNASTSGGCTANTNYSGCNRTVCTYEAAQAICSFYKTNTPGNYGIHIASTSSLQGLLVHTTSYLSTDNRSARACTRDGGTNMERCYLKDSPCKMKGTERRCTPYSFWSNENTNVNGSVLSLTVHLYNDTDFDIYSSGKTIGRSVRCTFRPGE